MNGKFALSLSVIILATAGVVSNVSAHEKTPSEVQQELSQAGDGGQGADVAGATKSRSRLSKWRLRHTAPSDTCNGPASWCTIYF